MKTVAVLLAGSIAALPLTSRAPDPPPADPQITFLEGVCIGFILGCIVDAGVVTVIKCKRHAAQTHWTNAPPPVLPAPNTNSLPALTNCAHMAVLRAGEAIAWFDLDPPRPGFDSFYLTDLEVSEDSRSWRTAFHLSGWTGSAGSVAVVSDTHGPIATNYVAGTAETPLVHLLGLRFPEPKQFFRLKAP